MTARRTAPVVAIDGPAGAGKSTVARRVAEELGYMLLDSGALYRSVALAAFRAGRTAQSQVAALARELAKVEAIRFEGSLTNPRVLLRGEDVTQAIRTPEIGTLASQVSAIAEVREALLDVQRDAGADGGVVIEGRDIGSVVFPDAEAKFFLTASVEARAARRFEELKAREQEVTLPGVENEVRERDRRDSSRPVAPLTKAADAELLDSTGLSIEQVVAHIVDRVRALERRMSESKQ